MNANPMNSTKPLVAILMGSASDWPQLKDAAATLSRFGVPYEVHVLSAHRAPVEAVEFARAAEERGLKVLIAAAGGAAHLAGALAAHSTLPVLGIPLASTSLNGLDALFSTAQMPPGIPVGTLAIGPWGATNAASLAVQILALGDPDLKRRLHEHKASMRARTLEADAKLRQELTSPGA